MLFGAVLAAVAKKFNPHSAVALPEFEECVCVEPSAKEVLALFLSLAAFPSYLYTTLVEERNVSRSLSD